MRGKKDAVNLGGILLIVLMKNKSEAKVNKSEPKIEVSLFYLSLQTKSVKVFVKSSLTKNVIKNMNLKSLISNYKFGNKRIFL